MKTNIHIRSYLDQFFLEWEMFQTEFSEKIKTHFMLNNLPLENRAVYEIMWKSTVKSGRPQATVQYGARALHAGKLRLHPSTQNMQYVLLFHCNGGCTNAPQFYAIRTMPVLFYAMTTHPIQKQKETAKKRNNASNHFNGSNVYDLWAIKWLCERESDNPWQNISDRDDMENLLFMTSPTSAH